MHEIKQWFFRYFDRAENILFVLLLIVASILIWFFGSVMAPFFASLLLAYLLNMATHFLVKTFKIKRIIAIILLFVLFALSVALIYAKLIPVISNQITLLIQQIPNLLKQFHAYLASLPTRYPSWISEEMISKYGDTSSLQLGGLQQIAKILTPSLNSISSVVEWVVYLFLVPIVTFLLLKDKNKFKNFFAQKFPMPRGVMLKIGKETQAKLGRYARGIIIESVIVGMAYIVLFLSFKLNYAILLGVMGGVVVFMPIVGTLIMTVPVLIVGIFQLGLSSPFLFLMLMYILIHMLDAYILAPWLFGKTLNLHPLGIIFALVVFGSIFGFWGLVFAIPLAKFISIVFNTYNDYGKVKRIKPLPYQHC